MTLRPYADVLGTVLCCPDATSITDALILPGAENVDPWQLSDEGSQETTLHQQELPLPVLCPVTGAFDIQWLVEAQVQGPRPLSQLETTQKGPPRSELPVTPAESCGRTALPHGLTSPLLITALLSPYSSTAVATNIPIYFLHLNLCLRVCFQETWSTTLGHWLIQGSDPSSLM